MSEIRVFDLETQVKHLIKVIETSEKMIFFISVSIFSFTKIFAA